MVETKSPGILSLVGTPIGNLSDVSPRVLETLRSADVLLCEDTRVTSRLLAHFDIHVPLWRADDNVLAQRIDSTLERIEAGERVAFVSDAGMPGVSDPGQRLVDAALDRGLKVEVIPGPSAVTCALVLSGLSMDHFYFEGFLPRKEHAMEERLRQLAAIPGALVIYESPYRVATTLQRIAGVFPQRKLAMVRELTKLHEEVVRGDSGEVARQIAERKSIKGECVIVIGAPSDKELASNKLAQEGGAELSLEAAIQAGLVAGEAKTALAKRLSKGYGVSKAQIYDLVIQKAQELEG